MEEKEDDILAPNLAVVIGNVAVDANMQNAALVIVGNEQDRFRITSKNFIDDNSLVRAGDIVNITSKPQMATKVPEILAKYSETQYSQTLNHILPILCRSNPTVSDIETMISYKLFKNYILYNILQPSMFLILVILF